MVDVLNRDGWCCSNCGYVPFHTFKDFPWWARKSFEGYLSFINDLKTKPPIIFVEQELISCEPGEDLVYKFSWLHGGELEFDHIIPVCECGSSKIDNYQALCHNCHIIKSNLDYRYTEATKYVLSKYQPVRIGTPPLQVSQPFHSLWFLPSYSSIETIKYFRV